MSNVIDDLEQQLHQLENGEEQGYLPMSLPRQREHLERLNKQVLQCVDNIAEAENKAEQLRAAIRVLKEAK